MWLLVMAVYGYLVAARCLTVLVEVVKKLIVKWLMSKHIQRFLMSANTGSVELQKQPSCPRDLILKISGELP